MSTVDSPNARSVAEVTLRGSPISVNSAKEALAKLGSLFALLPHTSEVAGFHGRCSKANKYQTVKARLAVHRRNLVPYVTNVSKNDLQF